MYAYPKIAAGSLLGGGTVTLAKSTVRVFSQKVSIDAQPTLKLALMADERQRSRYHYRAQSAITDMPAWQLANTVANVAMDAATDAVEIYLQLPRGTVLHHNDRLGGEDHSEVLQIIARPEPVLTVRSGTALGLTRAAYHLGNRHVPVEIGSDYLRLAADSVLEAMLRSLGVQVASEIMPFQPEAGAYGHHH